MPIKYLKPDTTKLYKDHSSNEELLFLLWGDRIEVLSGDSVNGRVKVKARGQIGYVLESELMDEPLLEIYFIDVGQGDGVLIVTPDRKHVLIDGGYHRKAQPHGKSAADFVDWKFYKDYGMKQIEIDSMISSHCDADHYGGLWDLLNIEENYELDCKTVKIENFYHAGVSWWKSADNNRFLGHVNNGHLMDLLEGEDSVENALSSSSDLQLQGNWGKFIKCVKESGATINRLSYNPSKGFNYLPGFEQDKDTSIKILGPIENVIEGRAGLKDFKSNSQNTNGNSILLRVDYGRARVLLTGDLNKNSQQHILKNLEGNRLELSADVAKSCHHGSDDCSFEFMESVHAAASIISSGDDETHAHPRPNIVATCGLTGYKKIDNDELITPLIFSTEISRSLRIGDPYKIAYTNYSHNNEVINVVLEDEYKTEVSYKRVASGALRASTITKSLNKLKIIDGIVYGLVNIRTDGNRILCATLNEGKSKWEIKNFRSRF